MRFMVFVKATEMTERGEFPPDAPLLFEEMDRYNDELIKAGVMIDGAGLKPTSAGARVNFDGPEPTVMDGPFAETKELVAGYWVWNCKDLADAIAWLKKAPFKDGTLEIRPFYEPEDLAHMASDEIIEKE